MTPGRIRQEGQIGSLYTAGRVGRKSLLMRSVCLSAFIGVSLAGRSRTWLPSTVGWVVVPVALAAQLASCLSGLCQLPSSSVGYSRSNSAMSQAVMMGA